MKILRFFLPIFILTFFYSCQQDDILNDNNITEESVTTKSININNGVGIRIAILSDPHVMAPSLLVSDGPAFQEYLVNDPKLIKYSYKILQATVKDLISKKPDLVLIPGDITKDGEKVSHENVVNLLNQLTSSGIKVLITPGNHDINNPNARRFLFNKTEQVPTIQADIFKSLYAKFGFNNAIFKDPNSLSYVSEPINGLWIITIDANKYYENTTTPIGSGVIKPETMIWIKAKLLTAHLLGKKVIGMMHHGLIEHFEAQQGIDPGYVIDDWENKADELIDYGLRIILTGHFHATDITKREHNGKFIFDVETGSTADYPCTYRMLTINGDEYSFAPQNTTALMGPWFDTYAKTFLTEHLNLAFYYKLVSLGFSPINAAKYAPYFTPASMAHLAGDEVMPPNVPEQMANLNAVDGTHQLSMILGSLWTDINTTDNTLTINMATGHIE